MFSLCRTNICLDGDIPDILNVGHSLLRETGHYCIAMLVSMLMMRCKKLIAVVANAWILFDWILGEMFSSHKNYHSQNNGNEAWISKKRKVYISQLGFSLRKEDCKLKLGPLLFIVSKDFYNTASVQTNEGKNLVKLTLHLKWLSRSFSALTSWWCGQADGHSTPIRSKLFYLILSIDIFWRIKNVLNLRPIIFNIPKTEISHYLDCFIMLHNTIDIWTF